MIFFLFFFWACIFRFFLQTFLQFKRFSQNNKLTSSSVVFIYWIARFNSDKLSILTFSSLFWDHKQSQYFFSQFWACITCDFDSFGIVSTQLWGKKSLNCGMCSVYIRNCQMSKLWGTKVWVVSSCLKEIAFSKICKKSEFKLTILSYKMSQKTSELWNINWLFEGIKLVQNGRFVKYINSLSEDIKSVQNTRIIKYKILF